MDSSIELQKMVKDNADDLRNYLSDLATWAGEMKNKSTDRTCSIDSSIPPIRNHTKKRESNDGSGHIPSSKVSKRISSFNYEEWEKFDVEKACEDIDKSENHPKSCEPDLMAQDEAQFEKEKGNRFVKNGKWDDAIVCYSKAIKSYPKDATFYANRALCYLKKKEYRSVEADCTAALQLEADYVKALQRRSTARRELNQFEDALKDLEKALILEPGNTALKADIAVVKQKLTSSDASKPKITQENEPLKWIPPSKAGSSSFTSLSTTAKTAQKSAASGIPAAPVVIEPAKKHQKSGQVSIGEDSKTKPGPNKEIARVQPSKIVSVKSEEAPDRTSFIKWFDKEGITTVQPVVKPPHRRAKEPLKRIPIKECPNYDLRADLVAALKENKKENDESSTISNILESNETSNKRLGVQKSEVDKPNEKCQSELYKTDADIPVPSTSVQFIATWKLIQNNPRLCFEFLKKISADDLHKIFQDCLESDILSGIISILEAEFTRKSVPVYEYLLGLCKVRRFSMLAMFLSATDKKGLQKLFEYCLTKEGCSEESVNNLKKLYEM